LCGGPRLFKVDVGHHDVRAILSERLGDCFSNSLRASGYDGNFIFQSIHLNPSFQFASLVMKSDEPGCAQPEICDVYSLFVCK
jgi:hypothetical protein